MTRVDDWTLYTSMDLTELRTQLWPDLCEARFHPVTDSLTAALPDTPNQIESKALEARKDAWAKFYAIRGGYVPSGEHPSPVSEYLLDTIRITTITIVDLADHISRTTGLPHGPFRAKERSHGRGYDDPNPQLHWATLWIENTLHACNEKSLRTHIDRTLRMLQTTIRASLGYGERRIHIDYACPWCSNKGLYLYPADRVADTTVRCLTKGCAPPDADCGTYLHGQPVWTSGELDWLAQRLGLNSSTA
jgi:hypothetical protein